MMSSLTAKFTFPETLGGQHRISSTRPSSSKQTQNTEQCIYVVQEYNCPHHPSLNTPHIYHRTPCPQALLPLASQTDCNSPPRKDEDELVEVSRYVRDRGCMECKTLACARRHEEAAKHPEILRRMQEMGLGQESIDHFEKVTSRFPASRRVLEVVRERLRRERVSESLGGEKREDDTQDQVEAKQESQLQSKIDNVKVIPSATLASSVEGPIVEETDSAEKEYETTNPQAMTTKVEEPQRTKILSNKKTPQPSAKSTEVGSPRPIVTPKVVRGDELAEGQTDKEKTAQPSTKPSKLKHPSPGITPEEGLQMNKVAQLQPQDPSPADEENTSQPSTKFTELGHPKAIVAPRVVLGDEFTQPQSEGPSPTDKKTVPRPSTQPTALKNPTPNMVPEVESPTTAPANPQSSAPVLSENLHRPQATAIALPETPPNTAHAPEAELPTAQSAVAAPVPAPAANPLPLPTQLQAADIKLGDTLPNTTHTPKDGGEEEEPEKLTDNIHLDLDEEWEWAEESERVFGEVALAPSFGCQTGDEWIVVGSWEQ
ncbi:uncharacterized protein EAF01_006946 [Botrytis porri]|uniref:Uncharacterized protein n=1 Tax=Botrytis porri TaxID=87229 RepID=A0A4Z1KD63_9HELO|nr:uncharacterized protein EAF01_006946 [Botrytis porri]KAF7901647.1 hypothetical protein EAF01_006946 [Botrytis porri]TGO83316.1 hypothetical protein BPOR_0665g00030 [Botrytis porri]